MSTLNFSHEALQWEIQAERVSSTKTHGENEEHLWEEKRKLVYHH